MSNSIITLSEMHVSQKLFKNEELNEITQEIVEVYNSLKDHAQASSNTIAQLLSEVRAKKLYTEDGFDSVADYAYQTFGMAKSTAYSMADAGDMYKNPAIPATIRELPPSKLVKLKSISPAEMEKDIFAGKLSPDMTQKELGEYAKQPKVKTAKKPLSYRASYIWGDDKKFADGMGDRAFWDGYFENKVGTHMVGVTEFKLEVGTQKLPPITKTSKTGKKTKIERALYYSERYAVVVEYYPIYAEGRMSESEIEKRLQEAKDNADIEAAIEKVLREDAEAEAEEEIDDESAKDPSPNAKTNDENIKEGKNSKRGKNDKTPDYLESKYE